MTSKTSPGGDIYRRGRALHDIHIQTPPEVWREYRENGYTIEQALNEELSYAE